MNERIRIDVWADIACPWCYIGKRRMEAGIGMFDNADAVIRYRSFQLDPGMPDDFDGGAAEYLARHKGIPEDRARAMQAHVASVAAGVGLEYDFSSQRPANSHRAHQLIHLARAHGVEDQVVEALYRAHFVDGRHIGQREVLVDIAVEAGIEASTAAGALEQDTYARDVDADIDRALQLGVTSVPFFVFNGRLAVSGAQSPETFLQALHQAADPTASPPGR